jgi:hypothetical protein
MAAQLQAAFPRACVQEVSEEEIPVVREKKGPIQDATGS